MMWFYERGAERLHCEMRQELDGTAFELVIKWPDGHVETETYRDQARILRRWCELDRAWQAQGWTELNARLARTSQPSE
jgi:hypothetical protein